MKKPLVSVVINCLNGEKYLKEAIDSVYAQTYKNWEIVFWDNASSDNTGKIAQSYDDRLRYFRSESTTILGIARVAATEKTQGDYIAFLDADDIWMPDKLAQQLELFCKNSNLGLVYGRTKVIFENSKSKSFIYKDGEALPKGNIFEDLLNENFIVFSSALVCKKRFYESGGFPETFLNSTDYWAFLRISKNHECGVVDTVCCKNRIHDDSLSNNQKVIGAIESIAVLESMLPDKLVQSGLTKQYANLAVMYMKEGRFLSFIYVLVRYRAFFYFIKRAKNKIKSYLRS